MSFNNHNKSFSPFDNQPQPFWQMLLLVAVPAFVGACLPPVIAHYLSASQPQQPPPPAPPVPPEPSPPRKPRSKKP